MTNNTNLNSNYYRPSTLKPSETSPMFEQIHSVSSSWSCNFHRHCPEDHKACINEGLTHLHGTVHSHVKIPKQLWAAPQAAQLLSTPAASALSVKHGLDGYILLIGELEYSQVFPYSTTFLHGNPTTRVSEQLVGHIQAEGFADTHIQLLHKHTCTFLCVHVLSPHPPVITADLLLVLYICYQSSFSHVTMKLKRRNLSQTNTQHTISWFTQSSYIWI